MFQCFTETKCMPCAFCGVFMQYMVSMVRISKDICNNYNDINIVLCNCLSKLSFIKYFVDALK